MILSQRINNNVNLHSIFKDISLDLIFCLPSILRASQKITLLWSTSLPVYDNMLRDINIKPSGSGGGAVAWLVRLCPPIYHCIQAAGLESVVHANVCVSLSLMSTTLFSPDGVIDTVNTGTVIKIILNIPLYPGSTTTGVDSTCIYLSLAYGIYHIVVTG